MSGAHWGAGLIGPDGTDYVAEQADALRLKMGRGIYSKDPHGTMGQWRDLLAIPLAMFHNLLDWMVVNGNPGTAEDNLPYWERLLGLAFHADRMTIVQRQQRCKARLRRWDSRPTDTPADIAVCIENGGFATEWNIGRQFWNLHYRAFGVGYTSFVPTAGQARYTLTVDPRMFEAGNAFWLNELTNLRDRLAPAWGEIIIA